MAEENRERRCRVCMDVDGKRSEEEDSSDPTPPVGPDYRRWAIYKEP